MREYSFKVPERYDGVRVRGFLRGPCRVSARLLAQCKRVEHGITAGGTQRIATDYLHAGEVLKLRLPEEQEYLPVHPNGAPSLSVLYEDASVLAADKPSQMIIYARAGQLTGTLRDVALTYFAEHGEASAFHPLYRLDRDTTGAMLLAKDCYAASVIPPTVRKTYLAVCEGTFTGQGTVDSPIGPAEGNKVRQCITVTGRPAITHWQALTASEGHTLVRCILGTGRTHQIRVHMASLGHPLAGDDFYGGSRCLIGRQALHCRSAQFCSPCGGEQMVTAPLPADFLQLLHTLKIDPEKIDELKSGIYGTIESNCL